MSNRGTGKSGSPDPDAASASPGRVRQRFEQWSANPRCEANVLSAVGNVRMDRVAAKLGLSPSMGQSPFALAAGNNFEAMIVRDEGKRLQEALAKGGVLEQPSARFVDFRTRDKGGPMSSPDAAEAATEAKLQELAAGGAIDGPRLWVGATITVPDAAMLPRTLLSLDALLVLPTSPEGKGKATGALPWRLVVGEVKSFLDRGGYTDRGKLASARAQAGVYVAGLRAAMESLRIPESRVTVATKGFLVFVRPGGRFPVVYGDEDFASQAARAKAGFARMRAIARTGPKLGDEGLDAVIAAPRAFVASCTSFCDLAPTCQKDAWDRGEPRVLGEDMAKFVGGVGLKRAYAILDGAKPMTDEEKDLKRRMDALEALRER
jgi:hypothetical protein